MQSNVGEGGQMSYPGGKGSSGTAQQIINCMPPHERYIECFLGAGTIMRIKKPAMVNIGIDADKKPITTYQRKENEILLCTDTLSYLEEFEHESCESTLIYADPPYLPATLRRPKGSTRNSQRYKVKFGVEAHQRLLEIANTLKCRVMISGYASAMYDRELVAPKWTRKTFKASTRNGMKQEVLWMNFDPTAIAERHDYKFIGDTFRRREVWKKRRQTIERKFDKLSMVEQSAMLELLQSRRKSPTCGVTL